MVIAARHPDAGTVGPDQHRFTLPFGDHSDRAAFRQACFQYLGQFRFDREE